MDRKEELLVMLRATYDSWEKLLSRMREQEITVQRFSSNWSIKDVIAHLGAWQQISIARLDAAILDVEPELPVWLAGADPYLAEDHTSDFNAQIYVIYQDVPWPTVHQAWSEGYLRLIALAEELPEEAMFAPGRYPWLKGDPLATVLVGSYEHHQEHLENLSRMPE